MDELVEAVDHNGHPIGVIGRKLANRIGVWHFCAQVFVLVTLDDEPAVVFQRRPRTKSVSPGVLDISASGHVTFGQTVQAAALREVEEELGLHFTEDDLVHVGRRIDMYEAPGVLSRIFAEVYVARSSVDVANFKYDRDEIEELVVIPASKLADVFARGIPATCIAFSPDQHGENSERTIEVTASEFLPRMDNLYYRIARYALNDNYIL
ncbi:NUDIX hydrolase [Micromonospora psammae]|uniref:NUDIX hydrolase n=1 Tax=Micromonospora sp. CPCC 205556 TaxID=3122398 RepID=UPI002FF0B4E8